MNPSTTKSLIVVTLMLAIATSNCIHAATLTVTNTSDTGPGSLRQAIPDSNSSGGVPDTIEFSIPGAGPHTIQPGSALPSFTDTSEFSACIEVNGQAEPCPTPFPDFNVDLLVNSADVLLMIQGLHDADPAFDITGEGTTDENDLVKFSLNWYVPNCGQEP